MARRLARRHPLLASVLGGAALWLGSLSAVAAEAQILELDGVTIATGPAGSSVTLDAGDLHVDVVVSDTSTETTSSFVAAVEVTGGGLEFSASVVQTCAAAGAASCPTFPPLPPAPDPP